MNLPSSEEPPHPDQPPEGVLPGHAVPDPEELQQWLPQYHFQRLIAAGGMGAVYLAWQPGVERWVAVKVLPVEASENSVEAERFHREALALAKLAHPNIVGIFDFGQTQAGHLYLVMEHVEGADLHWRTLAGEITPEKARTVIAQMCDALQYAHENGVIHRDIKPANILITPGWQVKVADFGLAKDLAAETVPGEPDDYGTPEYTAPERFARGATVDHRADIYSLGVVIHEILTGQTPKAAGAAAGQGLPPGFAGILSKCLMQDPARRYQTAREVKVALVKAAREVELKEAEQARDSAVAVHQNAPRLLPPRPAAMSPAGPPSAPAGRNSMLWGLACALVVLAFGGMVWRDHYQTPTAAPTGSPMPGGTEAVDSSESEAHIAQSPAANTKPKGDPVFFTDGDKKPPVETFSDMGSNIEPAPGVVSDSAPNSMNKNIPAALAFALSATSAYSVDYASQIVPILRTKCYDCHSEAKGKEKGDVALDTEAKMKAQIGPGQHIVPGAPEKSTMLIICKLPDDDSDVMPPKGKNRLTKDELALLENWIKEGANLAGGGAAPAPAPAMAPATMPAVQSWTSSDGKVIQASFISLAGENLTLKRADGQEFTFPLSRLSAESQAQARAAAAGK